MTCMFFATSKSKWRAKILEMGISKTSYHIQIEIKIPNPNQEPPQSSKAQDKDLKDIDVLCIFKIKIEIQNSVHGCTKVQWPYKIQDQDAKPESVTSSMLQSHKSRLQGHVCWLHLHNQDRDPKFGTSVYQRPETISKWRLRCQTPVRNFQHHQMPQMRT